MNLKINLKKTSWYELLGFDTSCWYNNIKKIYKEIDGKYSGTLTIGKYRKLRTENDKLPPYPHYLFKLRTFDEFKMHLFSFEDDVCL